MSRLIDADELVKKFKQWMGIEYRMQMFIADVIKTIKGQPTVEVPVTGKWIPWDKKNLPPEGELVEVTIKPKILKTPLRDIGYYDRDREEWWKYDEDGLMDVIAWKMPSTPYRPNRCHGCFGAENNDCERCVDEE